VRVQGLSSVPLSEEEEEEEVDEFLSSLGFEFVDACHNTPASRDDGADALSDGKSIYVVIFARCLCFSVTMHRRLATTTPTRIQ
jgi:hypothetical protein